MKHVRTKLIIFLILTVMISSFLATILSILVSTLLEINGVRMWFRIGFALREILAPILTMIIATTIATAMAKKMVLPVIELSKATKEIAAGNFDVTMSGTNRIDEFGELSRDFMTMAQELKANEYLAKDFISNVSHEFRTPLSIISGYTQLLDSDAITPAERHDYAQKIKGETDHLIKLASNILVLSKLDNQTIMEPAKLFSLDEQLRQTVLELESGWNAKRISLEIDIPEISYLGNEALLAQVWFNLLENAIKYTGPDGFIKVRASLDTTSVQVEIEDNGIGLAPATQERIFERFYQGDPSHSEQGNGLGLALVKQILELLGGSISVESSPGNGSRFCVTLPVDTLPAPPLL